MDEVIHPFEPQPPWHQRAAERDSDYAWLQRYLELGTGRTLAQLASRIGVPVKLIRESAKLHDWDSRAIAWDHATLDVSRDFTEDEKEALAQQNAVGDMLIRMGIAGLKDKNPALMDVAALTKAITEGVEAKRRAAGVADLKVDHQTTTKVESILDEFL